MNQPILLFKFMLPLALLLLSVSAAAVKAPHAPFKPGKQSSPTLSIRQFSESSNSELETLLGKKLSWEDRLVLKILKKRLRKAIQQNPSLGEVPFGEYFREPCSKITLHSGEVIEANILKITATRVVYRRCGRPNAPEIDIAKSDVDHIIGPNGKLIFQDPGEENAYSGDDYSGAKTDETAVWALICSILGVFFFPLLIAGAIMGFKSLRKIRQYPDEYKGKGLALAAIIIGFVYVAMILLLIAVFAASFG